MRILLLDRSRFVNGTATMVVRMANQMNNAGQEVYYLKFPEKLTALEQQILPSVKIISWVELLPKLTTSLTIPDIDVIYSYTSEMFFVSFFLKKYYFPNATLLTGVYHPRQYFFVPQHFFYQRIFKKIFKNFPAENLVFMSEIVKKSHVDLLGIELSYSNIIPIPVNLPKTYTRRNPKKYKVVSIGRLVDFKQYNFGVIDAITELKQEGTLFEYHIYGDGPLMNNLQEYAKNLEVNDQVFFHGQIPYEKMNTVLEDAYCFVGCGTTLVEAAALGIPAYIGVDSLKETYGLMCHRKEKEVGDKIPNEPTKSFAYFFKILTKMSSEEYREIQYATFNCVSYFETAHVCKIFCKTFETAKKDIRVPITWFDVIALAINKLIIQLFKVKLIDK